MSEQQKKQSHEQQKQAVFDKFKGWLQTYGAVELSQPASEDPTGPSLELIAETPLLEGNVYSAIISKSELLSVAPEATVALGSPDSLEVAYLEERTVLSHDIDGARLVTKPSVLTMWAESSAANPNEPKLYGFEADESGNVLKTSNIPEHETAHLLNIANQLHRVEPQQ